MSGPPKLRRRRLAVGGGPALVAALFMSGGGMVLPFLPLLARERGASYEAAGVLLVSYGVARLVSDLAAGAVIERFGRRRIGICGCALVATGAVATASAGSLGLTAASWGAVGVGSSLVLVSLYSAVLASTPPDLVGQAFGVFFSGFNVGIIAGAVLGGAIADRFGVEAVLYGNAVIALACLFVFRVSGSGTPRADGGAELTAQARASGLFPLARLVATALAVEAVGMWIFVGVLETAIPLYAREDLHLSAFDVSLVFAVVLLGELAFMYPMGRWVDHFGHRVVLLGALTAMLIVVPLLPLARTHLQLMLCAALLGITTGAAAIAPASMLRQGLGEDVLARASGLLLFCGDIGFILGPIGAGLAIGLAGFDYAFALLAAPLAALIAAVVVASPTVVQAPHPPKP